jgi:hypothetical protein
MIERDPSKPWATHHQRQRDCVIDWVAWMLVAWVAVACLAVRYIDVRTERVPVAEVTR